MEINPSITCMLRTVINILDFQNTPVFCFFTPEKIQFELRNNTLKSRHVSNRLNKYQMLFI